MVATVQRNVVSYDSYKENPLLPDPSFPIKVINNIGSPTGVSSVSVHWHNCMELLCFYQGGASVRIGSKCIDVRKGDLVLINAFELHSLVYDEVEGGKQFTLLFSPSLLVLPGRDPYGSEELFSILSKESYIRAGFDANSHMFAAFLKYVDTIVMELERKSLGYRMIVKGCLQTIIGYLLRMHTETYRKKRHSGEEPAFAEILEKVLEYVQRNFNKDIRLEDLARIAHMSRCHFSRVFAASVGMTFRQYLREVRLAHAAYELLNTEKSIAEIALDCGFGSTSSFTKSFKEQLFCTPSQFRETSSAGHVFGQ